MQAMQLMLVMKVMQVIPVIEVKHKRLTLVIQIMQASESALELFCANKKVAQLDSKFNFSHFSLCIQCVDLSGFSSPKMSHLVPTN